MVGLDFGTQHALQTTPPPYSGRVSEPEMAEALLAEVVRRRPELDDHLSVDRDSPLVWLALPDGRSIPAVQVRLQCVKRWAILDPDDERRVPIVPDDPGVAALADELLTVYDRLV